MACCTCLYLSTKHFLTIQIQLTIFGTIIIINSTYTYNKIFKRVVPYVVRIRYVYPNNVILVAYKNKTSIRYKQISNFILP